MGAARSHLNRLVLLPALFVVLPIVVVAERLRPGWGRAVAVGAIRRVALLCGIRFEVHGTGLLEDRRAYVFVPNHASPIDIAAVLVARPGARFVAAEELFRIPLLAGAMRALRTVPIRRGDRVSARSRIAELCEPEPGRQLVMFPEGRIAPSPELLPFKTGPFVVAIGTGAAVVPVAIRGAAQVLPPRGRLRVRPGIIHVDILHPVTTTGLDVEHRRSLADAARDRVREALAA